MHAIVVADGRAPQRPELDRAWPGWAASVDLVVGADGGALTAERLELPLGLVVGDADSAGEEAFVRFEASGLEVLRSPRAKDETDTELALVAALARGSDRVTIVAALGGPRLDHELANVALLAHPGLIGCTACLLDEHVRVSLITAPTDGAAPVIRDLPGPIGSTLSLLPFDGDAVGVTTDGFAYPLRGETLPLGPARGLSNVRVEAVPRVSLERGRMLVVEVSSEMLLRSTNEHA